MSEVFNCLSVASDIGHKRLDLAHICRLTEVLVQGLSALDSAIGDLTDLFRVEDFPALAIHVLEKGNDVHWINEVDESISDIATIVDVQGQVEEVELTLVVSVNPFQEHILGILVWDVTNHNCGARIFSPNNPVKIDAELRVLMATLLHSSMGNSSWHIICGDKGLLLFYVVACKMMVS